MLPGPPAYLSRLAIVQAIPAGSKRVPAASGGLFRAVVADPVIASLRADRRRAVLELARILARHADWRTMTSWRPRERACAEDRQAAACDPLPPTVEVTALPGGRGASLRSRGFLGLVAQGWTSALRASASSMTGPAPTSRFQCSTVHPS